MVIYTNDHLGTPQKLTAVNGAVVWSAKYSVFGKADIDISSSITNNLRFPGQYFDQETDFHYNYHRYYDPRSGRYLKTDPYKGNIVKPGTLQPYFYCLSNPIVNTDRKGLSCGHLCMPYRGKIETEKLDSEVESWLHTADFLCYYFTREKDFMQRVLKMKTVCIFFKDDGCNNCVFDRIAEGEEFSLVLSTWTTSWKVTKKWSERPVSRYMGHLGPVTECAASGPNYKGKVLEATSLFGL